VAGGLEVVSAPRTSTVAGGFEVVGDPASSAALGEVCSVVAAAGRQVSAVEVVA
jgi:hypothetical protein